MKTKTIDITAKEWFDKVNGNSYFSARVTVNYGMKSEKTFAVPFQYGYGDHYQYKAMQALVDAKVLPSVEEIFELQENTGIIIRRSKMENCKKKDVVEFGTL